MRGRDFGKGFESAFGCATTDTEFVRDLVPRQTPGTQASNL